MSQSNISIQNAQLVKNQIVPDEGPKAIPVLLDFSGTATEIDLDLLTVQQQGYFSMLQTIYIDLSGSANNLTIIVGNSNQKIVAKPSTQGYYNVLAPNNVRLRFQSAAGGTQIPLFLINVPVAGVVWATS